ncbi:glycosyltransferase family 2 protein [Kineococcus rubinsiae]|uniref:glycosyltransferase family 2 protein n=1 Tax=Kineococcus rubinsiae TaxID=2609562 RepID=UPI001430B400|nr:glycosyltransferase family 2 protein [Kineococcus rubinsiae]NIZ92026.1 glycosyltransferase family 2 protein [Kineococcus rubinsiae]
MDGPPPTTDLQAIVAAATSRPPSRTHDVEGDLVTVVIPAKDEEAAIGACLRSVLAQDWPHLQVLVVDGASSDSTVAVVTALAARDPRVELLVNPRGIIPASLNLAVRHARGRWLVRIDAHASVPPDYVRTAVAHLSTGRWGGVGGRKDGIGGGPSGDAIAAAMASRFGVGGSTYHHGTVAQSVEHIPFGAYPLSVVRELGGWDEDLRVNQDFEFDYRVRSAGHQLLFDPALVIKWENRQTVAALFQQYRRYGRGKVKVASKHPRSLRPRHLAAPALVLLLATAAAAGTVRPRVGLGLAAPYGLALAVATARTAPQVSGAGQRARLVAAFAAMHVGWGLGFYQGLRDVAVSRGTRSNAG